MKFQELTDRQWDTIAKHLREPASTRRPRCDDRTTINGIMFVLATGCTGGRSFQRDMAQNQLHTYDSRICSKREYGKRLSLSCAIKSAHKKNRLNLQKKISVDSLSIPAKKGGDQIGYDDGFKRISGTKLHVAVESNGLTISIVSSRANEHDSARFIDVIENMPDCLLDDSMMEEGIVQCYADRGYDAAYIRNYLRRNGVGCCIPYRSNSKFIMPKNLHGGYSKTRFVVRRFSLAG